MYESIAFGVPMIALVVLLLMAHWFSKADEALMEIETEYDGEES